MAAGTRTPPARHQALAMLIYKNEDEISREVRGFFGGSREKFTPIITLSGYNFF
jgi:hypothetical protein